MLETAASPPADVTQGAIQEPSAAVLRDIIDNMPVALTVQDEAGRFIVANSVAAANLGMPANCLVGASPADFLPPAEAAGRRQWEQALISENRSVTVEAEIAGSNGESTWLVAHTPARIAGRALLISSAVDITERKKLEQHLVERAHVDKLTGLPDRTRIEQQVELMIRQDQGDRRFALAFIDLDNFKHINDYYSHAIGDALLVKIGQRISRRLGPGDMLARISGDEYLLLLGAYESAEHLPALVGEILKDLRQPFHIEAFEVFSSCSIGVSLYPEHGRSYEALRRNADSAMYRAKHDAKGNAVFFDQGLAQAISARMDAEQRLRLVIRDRRFRCAFQPKIDVQSQRVIGFETLVRWRDDNGEIQPPGEFIRLAVELGLIDPITTFVTAEAIASLDRLDAAFGGGTSVSINVAARQASDVPYMASLVEMFKASGQAHRFIVELTEEAFIAKGVFQADVVPLLRDAGIRISIDDFGTGYSSLSALADITADELKIDRSFISRIHERPRNQSVLRAIESLGHALGMSLVAEGVETFEELAYLQAATRIRLVQGFYFSRPVYLDDLGCHERTGMQADDGLPRHNAEARAIAPGRSRSLARSAG